MYSHREQRISRHPLKMNCSELSKNLGKPRQVLLLAIYSFKETNSESSSFKATASIYKDTYQLFSFQPKLIPAHTSLKVQYYT